MHTIVTNSNSSPKRQVFIWVEKVEGKQNFPIESVADLDSKLNTFRTPKEKKEFLTSLLFVRCNDESNTSTKNFLQGRPGIAEAIFQNLEILAKEHHQFPIFSRTILLGQKKRYDYTYIQEIVSRLYPDLNMIRKYYEYLIGKLENELSTDAAVGNSSKDLFFEAQPLKRLMLQRKDQFMTADQLNSRIRSELLDYPETTSSHQKPILEPSALIEPPTNKYRLTYDYDDHVLLLRKLLLTSNPKFIDDIDPQVFLDHFHKEKETPTQKINWISEQHSLKYFIQQLHEIGIITGRAKFKMAATSITWKTHELPEHIGQSGESGYDPKYLTEIDRIISKIKQAKNKQ